MGLNRTRIPFCDYVWNPTSGCSFGCSYCYARKIATRFKRSFAPTCHPERLELPLRTRKPGRVFVDSAGDLFDPAIPDEFIFDVWRTMAVTPEHTFLILTKRAEWMVKWFSRERLSTVLPNVHIGVTITNQADADERIPLLLETPAAVRFLSIEPLLAGPIHIDWQQINWAILGELSGSTLQNGNDIKRWAGDIIAQCRAAGVPVWVKNRLKETYPFEELLEVKR